MGTIAKLVAEASVDPTGVRRGLQEAAREIQQFARTAQANFGGAGGGPLPTNLPPAWRNNARRMGSQLAREVSLGFGEGNAIANIRNALGVAAGAAAGGHGGGFLGTGLHLSGRHAFGLGVGVFSLLGSMEGIEAEKDKLAKTGKAVTEIIRALGLSLAVTLDPTHGAIVAIVAGGIAAITEHFTHLRSESAKLADDMEKNLRRIINSGNNILPEIQAIDVGEAAAGSSKLVPGAFAGGLLDLQAQRAAIEERIRTANFATILGLQRALKELNEKIGPLAIARARLVEAALNPTTARPIRGALPTTITAEVPKTPEQINQGLMQRANALVSLERAQNEVQQITLGLGHRLLGVYDQLTISLHSQTDQWGEQAIEIRKVLAELEKSPVIQLLVRPGALTEAVKGLRPTLTPQAPAQMPFVPATTPIPALPTGGPTIGAQVMATLGPALDAVSPALSAFAESLGPATLLLMAIQPALKILTDLLNSFVAPVAAVVEVMVQSLEPALRLLYPIVRAVAWVMALLSEIMQRITAALARVIGQTVIIIGEVVKKLSFGFAGKGIINAGRSILDFADSTKQNADEMARIRKKLGGMNFGQTADDITGLGDAARLTAEALRNIPEIWKVNIEKWRAANPIGGPAIPPTPGGPGGPVTGGGGGGPVKLMASEGMVLAIYGDVNIAASDPETLWKKLSESATREALRTTGRRGSAWTRL